MTRIPLRRGRLPAVALLIALMASLLPVANVYAVLVVPAGGGTAIPADHFGTGNFTTISGPSIGEQAPGFLALGTTTILNAPAAFQFNPGVGNVTFGGAGCNLAGTLTVTGSQATFTVTQASSVNTCILTFVGLQVQPTAGAGLVSANITKTGTSAAPGGATNYGTLTKVAGAVTQLIYIIQPSANNNGGTAFGTQPRILARDQFSNNVANAPIALAITPGTGATGAALTCNTNPLNTSAAGDANFAGQGCRIDLAGQYRLRASSGGVFEDSGPFNVNVGPAAQIVFKSYPGATTPPTLTPGAVVAVADAGGNTVTTFPANNISLAINKNGATFSCTGGLSVATVNGVATFNGCTQTTPDTGYQLTATIFFTNVVGPQFAVTPPTLAFIAGPGAPTAGQPFPTTIQVAIQNGGQTLTMVAATVTLAIGNNPAGGTLACPGGSSVGTVAGVATFPNCTIDNAGNGYTLTATASNVIPPQGVNPATSAAFNVGVATPATISLTTFCGTPTPISMTGPNMCVPDSTKSPPQANIKLPQTLSEGVWLAAAMGATGANRQIQFQVTKDQLTWSVIHTATTDAAGNASFFYRPSDNRYYRVVFAGAADLGAATSNTVRVVVRSLIFLRPTGCTNSASPCTKSRGATVSFTATARPNRPELPDQTVQFVVQQRIGSTWINVVEQLVGVSKATGTAVLNVTFSQAGTYRLRANLLPTPVNANSFPTEFEYYRIR